MDANISTNILLSKIDQANEYDINELIDQFNKLVISAENIKHIDTNEVDNLISKLKSLDISAEQKQKLIDPLEKLIRIILCKPKCMYFTKYITSQYIC